MRADEFVELLGGGKPAGHGRWAAHCPAHLDDAPSLSVAEGGDRILVHCHAGCALGSILTELGLDWRDIFYDTRAPEAPPDAPPGYVYVGFSAAPEAAPGVPRSVARPPARATNLPSPEQIDAWQQAVKVVSHRLLARKGWSSTTLRRFRIGWDGRRVTIPVRDGEGALVSLLRYLPGAHDYKMLAPKGAGRHLFPAPERLKAADLWLVEGEPDAITAFELDLPAVAVPGVATWKGDWTERFYGRSVTICFDADTQGREGARARLAEFDSAGIPARIVDLAPTKHNGYDLGDALADAIRLGRVGDLREYLRRLALDAWAVKGA